MPFVLYIVIFCTLFFFISKIIINFFIFKQNIFLKIPYSDIKIAWQLISNYNLYSLWTKSFKHIAVNNIVIREKIEYVSLTISTVDDNEDVSIWYFIFDDVTKTISCRKVMLNKLRFLHYFKYLKNNKIIKILPYEFLQAEHKLLSNDDS